MKVDELAEELGCEATTVLRLCRDRNIRASWGGSELDDAQAEAVRAALRPPSDAPPSDELPEVTFGRSVPGMVADEPPAAAGGAPPPPATPGGSAPSFSVPEAGASVLAAAVPGGASPTRSAVPEQPVARLRAPEAERAVLWAAVALVCGVGWSLLRLLPDWEEGRWWILPVALGAVTLMAAFGALVLGVRAVSEVSRHRSTRSGALGAVLAGLVGAAVLGAGVLLAVYDWNSLEVPNAWERLRLGQVKEGRNAGDMLEDLQGGRPADLIDVEGVPVDGLRPGQCLSGLLADDRERVAVTDCGPQHTGEVVGVGTLPEAPAYPGQSTVEVEAVALCRGPFLAYVGISPDDSDYSLRAFVPDKGRWEAGDRRIVCLAVSPGNGSTDTARGRRR